MLAGMCAPKDVGSVAACAVAKCTVRMVQTTVDTVELAYLVVMKRL